MHSNFTYFNFLSQFFLFVVKSQKYELLISYIQVFSNFFQLRFQECDQRLSQINSLLKYCPSLKSNQPLRVIISQLDITHKYIQILRTKTCMSQLTKKQQYTRIIFLGISFMIMFTSFNSLQNIVSKLYEEYDYKNLGQTAVTFIYGAFGVSTLFSSFIVKSLGYKKSMFFSSLGYGVFQATGFLVVTNVDLPHWVVWGAVILGAIICGVSASTLWVAQGAYTSTVADKDSKSELFGLFWALMMSSQILGNLLITFVLGKMSNFIYFLLLTILGFSSSLLFLFLPNVSNQGQAQKQQTTFKQEVKKVWAIASDKKYAYLNIYFWFPGLTVSFYAGFLYKLVVESVPRDQGESDDDYNHRLNFSEGLVFITLGLSQLTTGILMRFAEKFCMFKLAVVGTLIVEVAGFTSFICYFTSSYPLCFVCAALWGCAQNFLQTNTGAMISKIFPGKVEAFSVYRVFFSIGVVSVLILNIALSDTPKYIFLTIILVMQTIITGVSINLKDLKPETTIDQTSLISDKDRESASLVENK